MNHDFLNNSSRRGFLAAAAGATLGAAVSRGLFAATTSQSGMDELAALSLKEAAARIRAKKVSPVELTEACLSRIKTFNPKTNAFITVMKDLALAEAKEMEKEQAAGRFRGPLHGIPIALKDNMDTAGVRTTAGAKTMAGNVPTEDAEVARRLRAAGAIIIGKCNMHVFAGGATSAVSYYGPVRNPWNIEMIAGGSSGGSAAAVAMDQCYAALGTDTGGSIRTPSAMCGCVGFKPTYGRNSIRGIIPLTWSLDHSGPIARRVEDIAMVQQVLAGYDPLDLQSVDLPVPDYNKAIGMSVAGLRLGIPLQFFDNMDDDVAKALDDAIALLNKMTKGSKEIEMPSVLGTGAGNEGAVYREETGSYFVNSPFGSGGIDGAIGGGGGGGGRGGAVPAGRAVDYIREWRALKQLRRDVNDEVFVKQQVDLAITPTIRRVSWPIEEELAMLADPKARNPLPGNTRAFDDYGIPTLTVPCGYSKSGLPIGLQISGASYIGEVNVVALAYAYQEATEWHKRKPSLTADTKVPALSKTALTQTGESLTR